MSIAANFPTTRPSLLLDFVNSGQLDPRITFSRASGATWFNSAGTLVGVDFSSTSLTIGTGWQTLTLTATAGVDRNWIVGMPVQLIASTGTNTMTGVVVSYTASTQTLVVSVASVVGSGTYSTWRVSNLSPRFDYNPSTLAARGLLIEEQRTNSIRNNTMQGAVAGTPGTLPQVSGSASWFVFTALTGLTTEIIGTSADSGITYIDIRISGTPSAAGVYTIGFETSTGIAASNGQTWSESVYLKLQAGSFTGVSGIRLQNDERSASAYIRTNASSSFTVSSAALNTQRFSFTSTLSGGATVAFIVPYILLNFTGAAIDITLRIGLPQLELGAFATSVIPTTTTALTRSTDVANVNTLAPWYNATEGTLYVQAQDMSDAAHATSQPRAVSINNGTTSSNIDVSRLPASAQGRARVDDAGVNQFNSLNSAWPLATQAKVALAYKANDFAACLGGGTVFTDTSGTVPAVTTLSIGSVTVGGSNSWVGWIQRVAYYPRRLSNAELQAITA